MKKHVLTVSFVIILFSFGPIMDACGQLIINPQVGLSASTLSTDPDSLTSSARFGYQLGLSLRIGDRLHVQPGVYWQRSSTELKEEIPSARELNDSINLDAILITVNVGYTLFDIDPLRLRINGGLNGTSIVNVADSEFDDLVDFNTILLGSPVGVGVDILDIFSVDLSYEFGLTSLFDQVFGLDVDVTNNVFRLNVGLLL